MTLNVKGIGKTMTKTKEKYPVGTEVYYSLEDYNTGEDIIYKGKVRKIYYTDLELNDKTFHLKMYEVRKGLGMQSNSFYTLEELFKLKTRLEETYHDLTKDALLIDKQVYREGDIHVGEHEVQDNMDN